MAHSVDSKFHDNRSKIIKSDKNEKEKEKKQDVFQLSIWAFDGLTKLQQMKRRSD